MSLRAMQFDMVIVGPREGETVRYGDHTFIKGVCRVKVPGHVAEHFVARFARSYNAHPQGSPALAAAQEAWNKAKIAAAEKAKAIEVAQENGHGFFSDLVSGPLPGPADEVRREDGRVEGAPAPSAHAVERAGVEQPAPAGAAGPGGDGLQHAGDADQSEAAEGSAREPSPGPVNIELANAVKKLDPKVDDHWNDEGEPALAVVELAYGNAGITRQMVRDAAPGWNRDAARAAAAPAEPAKAADPLS